MENQVTGRDASGLFDGVVGSYPGVANTHGFAIFNHTALRDIRLFVVGCCQNTSLTALEILTASCAEVISFTTISDADLYLHRAKSIASSMMIFHCDRFSDNFDTLLFFRKRWPSVTVLVASGDLRRNDLSTARGLICDSSLRQPYTKVGLALALQAALNNSREMQQKKMYHWAAGGDSGELMG
jgi:hypothetical protein